jgi:site-specific recombinase XerC
MTTRRIATQHRQHGDTRMLRSARTNRDTNTPHTPSAKTSHTAAYRMARDPQMALTDVQWVLGHAHLSTTQLYVNAPVEDMIAAVLAHHDRRAHGPAGQAGDTNGQLRYPPESLQVLFGRRIQ